MGSLSPAPQWGRLRAARLYLVLCLAPLAACVPARDSYYRGMTRALQTGRYDDAAKQMERQGGPIYGSRDALLAPLDRAMVAFAAGAWPRCIEACEAAKRLRENLYTRHVHQQVASYLLGDDRLPYVGEPFERVALHLIEALAYLAQGNVAEARVEARAMAATLRGTALGGEAPHDSLGAGAGAFAHFLLGLLEADDAANLSRNDDAAMDLRRALALYEAQGQNLRTTPVPTALLRALCVASMRQKATSEVHDLALRYPEAAATCRGAGPASVADKELAVGRIVVLHLAGVVPAKAEAAWEAWTGLQVLRVPYPVYGAAQVPPTHLRVRLLGAGPWEDAELVSPLGAIARSTLAAGIDSIRDRAIARAVAAAVATDALVIGGGARNDAVGELMQLVGLGIGIGQAASAHADTRSWRTLPDTIELALLAAPAGLLELEVELENQAGAPAGRRRVPVSVGAGEVSFVVLRTL